MGVIAGVARIVIDDTNIFHEIEAELSMELETKERETKDTSGTEYRAGKKTWSMSGNGLQVKTADGGALDFSAIFAKFDASTEVAIEFTTDATGDKYFQGQALITNLTINAAVNEDPTCSWSLQGTGVLTEATV
jgi:predicted secreted protein